MPVVNSKPEHYECLKCPGRPDYVNQFVKEQHMGQCHQQHTETNDIHGQHHHINRGVDGLFRCPTCNIGCRIANVLRPHVNKCNGRKDSMTADVIATRDYSIPPSHPNCRYPLTHMKRHSSDSSDHHRSSKSPPPAPEPVRYIGNDVGPKPGDRFTAGQKLKFAPREPSPPPPPPKRAPTGPNGLLGALGLVAKDKSVVTATRLTVNKKAVVHALAPSHAPVSPVASGSSNAHAFETQFAAALAHAHSPQTQTNHQSGQPEQRWSTESNLASLEATQAPPSNEPAEVASGDLADHFAPNPDKPASVAQPPFWTQLHQSPPQLYPGDQGRPYPQSQSQQPTDGYDPQNPFGLQHVQHGHAFEKPMPPPESTFRRQRTLPTPSPEPQSHPFSFGQGQVPHFDARDGPSQLSHHPLGHSLDNLPPCPTGYWPPVPYPVGLSGPPSVHRLGLAGGTSVAVPHLPVDAPVAGVKRGREEVDSGFAEGQEGQSEVRGKVVKRKTEKKTSVEH